MINTSPISKPTKTESCFWCLDRQIIDENNLKNQCAFCGKGEWSETGESDLVIIEETEMNHYTEAPTNNDVLAAAQNARHNFVMANTKERFEAVCQQIDKAA